MEPATAKVTYSWTLNGTVVAATPTYTVPASAVTGDAIEVTVTDADGNKATARATVSGLTIAAVEPTTAAGTNGAGLLIGYKYVRIFFSEPLSSLDASEVEIRDVKSKQLYSIESLKLSSTGLFADVVLAGSYDADGTTFLMPNVPYVATIDHDGMLDSLEFELPATVADEVVIAVDEEENKIYTLPSGRTQGIHASLVGAIDDYYLGLSYSGNIGELLGRTVNFSYDGDDVITDLTVQDEVVVIDTMKYVDPNKNGLDKKDYMETNTGDKYYFETSDSATKNETNFILANNDNATVGFAAVPLGAALGADDGKGFDYVRLTLNPNGTIATMAYNEDRTDWLMVESVDDQVVIADKNTSMNFTGYTIFDGEALISTDDLEVGDVVYWSVADSFAYVYNDEVSGELSNVIDQKLDIDGTTYNWVGSKYYDTPNKKYVTLKAGDDAESVASQKYLNSLDPDEVTITLKMDGTIAFVDGDVVGEEEPTTTTYIIAGGSSQKTVSFDEIVRIPANDGTDKATLDFNPMNLKSLDGKSGKVKATTDLTANTSFTFTYKDDNGVEQTITKAAANDFAYTELVDITTDNSTGAIVGVKELASGGASAGNQKTAVAITGTSSQNKINSGTKTVSVGGGKSYALTASTKVWVVVNATGDTSAASVKMVKFSDFAQGTAAIGTKDAGGINNAFAAYVYPDKANAKHIVIVQTYADANPTAGNSSKAWETGETDKVLGVVVGETLVAKSDGSDALVVKTITVKDATGTEISLDADGQVATTVAAGDLVEVEYTKSGLAVVKIDDSYAWATGIQPGAVEYDSSVIKLYEGEELRPYSDCLILKHYTVGAVDHWDPITISEINSSKDGWNVKYHAVSQDGTKKTVDFVIVDDNGVARSAYDAVVQTAVDALVTTDIEFAAAGNDAAVETDLKTISASYTAAMGTQNAVTGLTSQTYSTDLINKTVTITMSLGGTATLNGFDETNRAAFGFDNIAPVVAVTRDLSDLGVVKRTTYRDGVKVNGPTTLNPATNANNVLYGDLGAIHTYKEELVVDDATSDWNGWKFVYVVNSNVSVGA